MKKHSYVFLFILLIGITITSCKKDKADPAPLELKFSAEALSYVELPLNRYFIYKDSASGILDSVVVTQSSLSNILMPAQPRSGFIAANVAHYRQTFTLTLTKYNGAIQQLWFYGFADNASLSVTQSNLATPLILEERDRVANAVKGLVFIYPFTNISGIATSVPTIIIEGKTYTNVITVTSVNTSDTTQPYYQKSTHYWVKGIGIIKREITTSTTVKTELLVRNG